MSSITTHILDAVLGKPAARVPVRLERNSSDGWLPVNDSVTNSDGRCTDLCHEAEHGSYRLIFATGAYFEKQHRTSIYPEIAITFIVDGTHSYHLPLLLSDNSYTTYRGS